MKNTISILFLSLIMQLGWSQKVSVLPDLIQKVDKAVNQLNVSDPNPMDPLTLNATLVWSEDKSQLAVIIKTVLLEGWHIYAYVPESEPYITSEIRLKLPDGIATIKDWEKPHNTPYEDGIYIYEETLIFVRYCSVKNFNKEDTIISGLYYQTCDVHKCFPPETKTINLALK